MDYLAGNVQLVIAIFELKLIFKYMVILIDILLLQSRLINSIEKYQIHLFCAIIVMLIIKFID